MYYRGRDMVLIHRGICISESDWNVFLGHAAATLAKFQVPEAEQRDVVAFVQNSRKRSLNNKDAERLCERAAPAPTEVVRGDARVGISRKHESLAIEQQVCLGSSRAIPRAGSNFR